MQVNGGLRNREYLRAKTTSKNISHDFRRYGESRLHSAEYMRPLSPDKAGRPFERIFGAALRVDSRQIDNTVKLSGTCIQDCQALQSSAETAGWETRLVTQLCRQLTAIRITHFRTSGNYIALHRSVPSIRKSVACKG